MAIIIQPRPKQRIVLQEEGRLQAECVKWYRNEWRKNPKNLWATFNEGLNMSVKLSTGLVGGVSDLLYKDPANGDLVGIEIKFKGKNHDSKHLIRQADWILDVCDRGGFCDSLEMFQEIIRGEHDGIDPREVIKKASVSKSVVW